MQTNSCPVCQQDFSEWTAYHEHLNLAHGVTHRDEAAPIRIELGDIATLLVTVPKDLKHREYKPMNPAEKRRIVASFERKMGAAIIGLLLLAILRIPARADMGVNFPVVSDSVNEYNAKAGANGLGITTVYDHPTDAPQGQMYVPVEYNRAGDPGAGEQDPNAPHNTTDIDYIPLAQLKGATGAVGASGAVGATGSQGVKGTKGDTGAKGDKGDKGDAGDDGNNRLTLNIGAQVRWHDWKHVALVSGYRYDVRHFGHTVDMLVVQVKIGKSYEERVLEKQDRAIRAIEAELSRMAMGPSVERVSELFVTSAH